MHNDMQPSNAQGKDNIDIVKQKGEETAHNDMQPSNVQGKDNVDGVKRKGEETAHNDPRPPSAQGKGNVDGVKQKGEETAHNDAQPYDAQGGDNVDGIKRKRDKTMERGGGLGRMGDVHHAVKGCLRLEVLTEVATAAGGTIMEEDVGEGTSEDAEFYGRGGGVKAHWHTTTMTRTTMTMSRRRDLVMMPTLMAETTACPTAMTRRQPRQQKTSPRRR